MNRLTKLAAIAVVLLIMSGAAWAAGGDDFFGFVSTRVPFGAANGSLTSSAALTFTSSTGTLTATKFAGNVATLTTLGDVLYGGASGASTRLAGNTTTTKKFLRQTGDGTVSAAPAWDTLVAGDVPTLTAAKISDFDTQVRTSRLDQLAAPTASVSLNSQKITSLLAPTAAGDGANAAYVQGGTSTYAADTGAANAYVVTLAPALAAYVAGLTIRVKISAANTGACTVNVNGLGVKAIKTAAGGDPAGGALATGGIYTMTYDGTAFQLQ